MTNNTETRYWETIPLDQLDEKQWESICDACAQCCAHKLQDEENEEVFLTNVVCQYLDTEQCQCRVYEDRNKLVPDCIQVTPDNAKALTWMPDTCGYKLLAQGKSLPDWHPLNTGDALSTQKANMTIKNKVICEKDIDMDDLEDYLVEDDYFSNLCRSIGSK